MLVTASISNSSLLSLLTLIQTQVQVSTLLVLSNKDFYHDDNVLPQLGVPTIWLTDSTYFKLKTFISEDILAIVYLNRFTYHDLIDILAKDLHGIAQTKIVFVYTGLIDIKSEIFRLSWGKKMINAIVLFEDDDGDTYSSYTPFPSMKIFQHSVQDKREVFPNRMLNLHGYPLRLVMDGVEPRDFVYTNRRGKDVIGGYTVSIISTFAELLNATVTTHNDKRNEVFYHTDYDELFRSDVVDIFGGLVMLIPTTKGQSIPAEVIEWCLMLPVEPFVPQYLYYPIILESIPILVMFAMVFVFSFTINCFLWIERKTELIFWKMFIKEDCVRALLGQPCKSYRRGSMKLRVVYFLCCFMGLIFNSQYLAALNKLVTSPPSEPRITNWQDIQRSHLKVFMYRGEYDDISKTTDELEKFRDTFVLPTNNTLYHVTRNSMNKSYAYPVPTNKWIMFKQQQSYYKAPIYRYTSDICVVRYTLMVFILNENSVFTRELNQMILRTHQSGLYGYWVKMAFLQLVEAGRIKINAHTEAEVFKPFALRDMKWLWGLFGALTLAVCGVFLVEITYTRIKNMNIVLYIEESDI